ncbi:MAG: CDP-glucose 4,6-dehydratase [Negativicutes bacterium]|jgi:CDP-glucose 4,6-dehydratase
MNRKFWKNKKVFITGHTGFKGSWLVMMLNELGAEICGYALTPPTEPSLFDIAKLSELCEHNIGDVRDYRQLSTIMGNYQPEIVIHMAAQPLVRESYVKPLETYEINVMGTANLLEAVRNCPSVRSVVVVTTDKCYQNNEWAWGYRENDRLGGYDPYSNSKACSELVVSAYRQSYFRLSEENSGLRTHDSELISAPAVATARAGNVIGGGDWAKDRLVPDILRSIEAGEPVRIRNPYSIRPWEHVLEPLAGYLQLAENLYTEGHKFAEAWNFGPSDEDAKPVEWIVERMCQLWNSGATYIVDDGDHPHEAHYLKLDCSKSRQELGWKPRWNLSETLGKIVDWHVAYINREDIRRICQQQIEEYLA